MLQTIRASAALLLFLVLLSAAPPAMAAVAPALAVVPASGPPDTIFALRATGLRPDGRYAATATDATGALLGSVESVADTAGGIALSYNSSSTLPGRYTMAIVEIGGRGAQVASAPLVVSPSRRRCFRETGSCIEGIFLVYWEAHGGLALNGYPLTEPIQIVLEDGDTYIVQYCERTRLEYHPENTWPNDVQLGQFGRYIHAPDPPAVRLAGGRYFAETGHNTRAGFRDYWERNGGLAQFGYPLTEEIREQLEDGRVYTVQYFERARFEYHPENRAPYDILLGQFGRRIHDEYNGPVRIPGTP